MSIMSVLGPIDADCLGITLAHEHLFIDLRNQSTEPPDAEQSRLGAEKVSLANAAALRRNPYTIRDNLLLDDLDMAVEEVKWFQRLGGATIVDCTSLGINRSPLLLRQLAQRTGLNVIAGCGYYTQDTHPADMAAWSAEDIAERLLRDLTVGIEDTGVRAGVIGEIGTSDPIHPNERKCLLGAALAAKQTQAALYVHTYPWGKSGLEASQLLIESGVRPEKIVICHIDVELDHGYLQALLARGVFVEFDDFGKEFSIEPGNGGFAGGSFARDIERVQTIKRLVDGGYERQVLVSNDICLKSMLRAYQGWGYDHILRHIVPMMLEEDISQEMVDTFLVFNPRRLLGS